MTIRKEPLTTTAVYEKYGVPPKLQFHMIRVAAVCNLIADNWIGPPLDVLVMKRICLLHDIGNIVKMDLSTPAAETDKALQDRCKRTKEKLIQRYGDQDHVVSERIAEEVGLRPDEILLMQSKVFIRNEETMKSADYSRKVMAYADQRAAPDGVATLLERLNDARARYRDKPGSSMNNPRTDFLINCAVVIERQLMEFCTIKPSEITNNSIEKYWDQLTAFVFET